MKATKKPGLSLMEEPGGRLRKQLIDHDGTVVLDESILPHDALIAFMQRPLGEYRKKLAELEEHPLFEESLDISVLDYEDFRDRCFDLAYSFEKDHPEACFFMCISLNSILTVKDDGSASFLLYSGMAMLCAVRQLYDARIRMQNIMEICFGTTEGITQRERWDRLAEIYPQLDLHAFASYWEHDDDAWVQRFEMRSLLELYFFELCAVLRTDKRISRCRHCWQYFVPKTKKKTDYCDYTWEDGRTCKQLGPNLKRKDGPAEDKYLMAAKILRARFYERYDKRYQQTFPEGYNYFDWSEEALHARAAYLKGEIDGEEFLRRIDPDGAEVNLERASHDISENTSSVCWESLVKKDMAFDPDRYFETMQSLDMGAADPRWKILTAEEQIRQAKHGEISLMEKYKNQN